MSSVKSKVNRAMQWPRSKGRIDLAHLTLLFLLSLLVFIGAVPGYLAGQWPWRDLPRVANINQIRDLKNTGLTLPGWRTLQQTAVTIGNNPWSIQAIAKDGQLPVTLYLLPQNYYRNHPQVEWVDLNGIERWRTDPAQTLTFTDPSSGSRISAHFFRAWKEQTFAVVQWYAWPGGGNVAPAAWFWADQWAQLHRRRVPWVAVCLKIPIDPFSNLHDTQSLAASLAQTVQIALDRTIFTQSPPPSK
jgi:cyanoexosortase B-associated protein